jgi:asparagine synthase (glutamine-hydrolysing)
MCGIAGKMMLDPETSVESVAIHEMLRPIRHRGPDGEGVRLEGQIGLAHARLAIIDLSTGAQPMTNEDRRIWIVFNGEIYNFKELRKRLQEKGHVFRSRTDTEVILHLYEELGPECVNELRGMFAFAIWDSVRKRLLLARDRVGIKPLYYCQTDKALYFASELKSILTDPAVPREVHLPALRRFFSFHYVPGEETLFRGIFKLPPGSYLLVEDGQIVKRRYWDLRFTRSRYSMPFDEAVDELSSLLRATVRDHMIADVPVGILLSGGVDSSAVVSLAVQATGKKVNTFTVGFGGGQVVDERPYARAVAEKFATNHFEVSIAADDFWNFLPSYIWHMEEPVHEPPAVALYYVSKLARSHVKVLLSGEGGDESFAGYPNYPNLMRLKRLGALAGPLARPAGGLAALAGKLLDDGRVQRYANALGRSLQTYYFSRTSGPTSYFNQEAELIFKEDFLQSTASVSSGDYVGGLLKAVERESLLNQMLFVDSKTWLPDDLLIKADKITMANSQELRVPLLDHLVIEFAASLPPDFKVRRSETKRILNAVFAKVLPEKVLSRKKAGFPIPYRGWLRREFRNKVEEVLLSDGAWVHNYVQKHEVERVLQSNADGQDYGPEIFCLLAVEFWHLAFMNGHFN